MSVTSRLENTFDIHVRKLVDAWNARRESTAPATGEIAGTEDGIGVAIEQRPEQGRVIARIVFEIGVLHQAEIAAGVFDGGTHGRAFALVHFVPEQANARFDGGEPRQDFRGAVSGTIVNDDEFLLQSLRNGRIQNSLQAAFHQGPLIVDGDEYGEFQSWPATHHYGTAGRRHFRSGLGR